MPVSVAPPEADGLGRLNPPLERHRVPIWATPKAMNGGRITRHRRELAGWQVQNPNPQNTEGSRSWSARQTRVAGSSRARRARAGVTERRVA
jgi:hypothetical protein